MKKGTAAEAGRPPPASLSTLNARTFGAQTADRRITALIPHLAGYHRGMKERVVVVTGASAGLGRAIVDTFSRQGASVALLARETDRLQSAASDIIRAGGRALAVPTDVAEWSAVQKAATQVEDELGPIDVWVNNAMSSVFAPFKEMAIEDFTRATEVTYLGYVHGTKAALDVMLPRQHGTIVQVGSALAHRGIPLQSAYCGAKHAMVGFTESLRTELRHDHSGIHVTMVHMPAMNTPQFDWVRSVLPDRPQPVAPIYQPEVGARAVAFAAAHPERRAYYVGASTTFTVLANKVVPQLLDLYLARTGYEAQQSPEPEDPGRPDNLYDAVDRPGGAHGRFDDRSHHHATLAWLTRHRLTAVAAAATPALGGLVASSARRRRGGART
jgi:NAD(P)-dependent dehydrogenase (short-subunit alcohol dehydrogenase family)